MNRRWVLVVALVVIAGLAVGLAFALRSPGPGVPRPLGAPTYARDLSIAVPRGFYVYNLQAGGPHAPGVRPAVVGHLLADFRPPPQTTIYKVLGDGLPLDEVAIELTLHTGPGPGPEPPGNLHLPLSLNQRWFQDPRSYHDRFRSGTVSGRWGSFEYHGRMYDVIYWIGTHAPTNDRAAVLRALHSIRPTR